MLEISAASEILVHLLQTNSPEFGARLKQRLNAVLAERGMPPFDEKGYGYTKFREFLEKSQPNISISRPSPTGDILVSLRGSQSSTAPSATTESATSINASTEPGLFARPIRSDIWQAFTNPDARRRRFLDNTTFTVRHYVEGESSSTERDIQQNASRFIPISPISGETHIAWMRRFLDAVPIIGSERTALDSLLAEPYTSGLNATFTRLLGPRANAWREQRTQLVQSVITEWASAQKVSVDRLLAEDKPSALPNLREAGSVASPRRKADALLDLMTDEDIDRFILPVLLSTLLIKSRM